MNETNNKMELNTPEVQKRKEKEAKKANFKNKIKEWKEKRQEKKEDNKRAKEEIERVKEQEKLSLETQVTNSAFTEPVLSNDTMMGKNVKLGPTLQESREKKKKRKKFIRNIMTIPEVLLVIILALFLKNRYVNYAKDAHQTLTYLSDPYIFEIKRDSDKIKVLKKREQSCETPPCENETISEHTIEFDKNKMQLLLVFMDAQFKCKNGDKKILLSDIKTDFGKKCIYSMINNKDDFLKWNRYHKYKIVDYEQMSNYTTRGFKYVEEGGKKYLMIALGEKATSGYNMIISGVVKEDEDLYFYVEEQIPSEEETTSIITHPLIKIELEETSKNIYVYNVNNGEEFINYDAPRIQKMIPSDIKHSIKNYVGDLAGSLRNEILKEK